MDIRLRLTNSEKKGLFICRQFTPGGNERNIRRKLITLLIVLLAKRTHLILENCQYILNPFRPYPDLIELLINEDTHTLLKMLHDEDYVLINAT